MKESIGFFGFLNENSQDDMEGFPLGHAAAVAGALKRGDPPPEDSCKAIDEWRDGIEPRRAARGKAREVKEMRRLMAKYPEELEQL